jgi:hypothetical protein
MNSINMGIKLFTQISGSEHPEQQRFGSQGESSKAK